MTSTAGPGTTERLVAGRYRLRSRLGKGGMGTVWLADDELLGRSVAVKEITFPEGISDHDREILRQRTMREARFAARLDHPAAVTVYDVVQEDGWPYIVMEFIRARTLAEVVREDGRLTPHEAARVGLAVLGALEAAHALSIVHRDVKPGNIMVREDGRVTLTDFGIATSTADTTITTTGLLLGSPSYMAPERVEGGEPGPASDLWSLGATLYAIVEGRPPFERDEPLLTLAAIVSGQPAPFHEAGPLAPVIQRLLARDPAERPTAAQVRRELSAIIEPSPAPVPAPVAKPPAPVHKPAVQKPPPPVPVPEERGYMPRESRSRSPWGIVLATVLVLALVGAVWLFRRADRGAAEQAAPATEQQQEPVPAVQEPVAQEPEPEPDPTTAPPTPTPEPTPTETPTPTPEGVAVPADFVRYTSPEIGYSVAHPPGWEIRPATGEQIDIYEPGGGRYLRIGHRSPPGESALGAWEEFEPSFSARVGNYQRIRMEEIGFREWTNAADWEYTYTAGGADLHAINRGFVADPEHAYALNFVTREQDWEASQDLFQQMAASFEPAP